jgi:hypothetical protein
MERTHVDSADPRDVEHRYERRLDTSLTRLLALAEERPLTEDDFLAEQRQGRPDPH